MYIYCCRKYSIRDNNKQMLFSSNFLSVYNTPIFKVSDTGLERIAMFCKFILNPIETIDPMESDGLTIV